MYKGLILKSHTLDFNTLVLVGVAVEQNLPMLKDMIPATVYPWITFGVLMTNVLLRLKTKGPVGEK
jgi:hypothetical protein